MSNIDDGGPAFPVAYGGGRIEGMTLRQYAAIKLKVPDSGSDRLDEMITKSLRNDFAAKAMLAVVTIRLEEVRTSCNTYKNLTLSEIFAEDCYIVADAMLKARGNE
jgi:hypothetical protein